MRADFRGEEQAELLEGALEALVQTRVRVAFAGTGRRAVAGRAELREAELPAEVLELAAKIGRERKVARRAGCPQAQQEPQEPQEPPAMVVGTGRWRVVAGRTAGLAREPQKPVAHIARVWRMQAEGAAPRPRRKRQ